MAPVWSQNDLRISAVRNVCQSLQAWTELLLTASSTAAANSCLSDRKLDQGQVRIWTATGRGFVAISLATARLQSELFQEQNSWNPPAAPCFVRETFTVRLSLGGEVQTVQSHHQVQAIFEWLEKLFDASSARAKNDESSHRASFALPTCWFTRGCSQKGLTQCVNLTKGPFKLVWA
jgi:hypothetical protein